MLNLPKLSIISLIGGQNALHEVEKVGQICQDLSEKFREIRKLKPGLPGLQLVMVCNFIRKLGF